MHWQNHRKHENVNTISSKTSLKNYQCSMTENLLLKILSEVILVLFGRWNFGEESFAMKNKTIHVEDSLLKIWSDMICLSRIKRYNHSLRWPINGNVFYLNSMASKISTVLYPISIIPTPFLDVVWLWKSTTTPCWMNWINRRYF